MLVQACAWMHPPLHSPGGPHHASAFWGVCDTIPVWGDAWHAGAGQARSAGAGETGVSVTGCGERRWGEQMKVGRSRGWAPAGGAEHQMEGGRQ